MDSFPYESFGSYFSGLIQRHFEDVQVQLNDSLIDEIYQLYLTGKKSQEIQNFITSLTSDVKAQKQILDIILIESNMLQQISQQFSQIIQQEENRYDQQLLNNDKLNAFLCSQLIIKWKLKSILIQQMELTLNSQQFEQLLSEFREIVKISDQQLLKEKFHQLLMNQIDYASYGEEARNEILEVFLSRKIKFEELCSLLEEYDVVEIEDFLHDLENMNLQMGLIQIEPQEEFNKRVFEVIVKYYKKVKKLSAQVLNQILRQLYSQINQLNEQKIKDILIKSRLAQNVSDIKIQMLKQIYQQEDDSFFKIKISKFDENLVSIKSFDSQSRPQSKINLFNNKQKKNDPFTKNIQTKSKFQQKRILNRDLQINGQSEESVEQNYNLSQKNKKGIPLKIETIHHQSIQRRETLRPNALNQNDLEVSEISFDLDRAQMTERPSFCYPGTPKYNTVGNDYDDRISMPGDRPSITRQRSQMSPVYMSGMMSRSNIFEFQEQRSMIDCMANSSFQAFGEQNQRKKIEQAHQINILNNQISTLKSLIKNLPSFQKLLRQIEINVRIQNQSEIISLSNKLEEMVSKYELQCNIKSQLQELMNPLVKKLEKMPQMLSLRRKIQGLNLQQIARTKKQIQLNQECNEASGVILIGETGAGKSTTLVGLMGNRIQFNNQTKDFQAVDMVVKNKFKISSSTMSVTRWANVSKLAQMWTGNQKIVVIDTPGLDDNRGVQIDITNNIGTVKLLKTLRKGRILIVLSKNNFRDRWLSDFVRIIRSISKYLTDIQSIKRSVTFVLTKGLTKDVLLDQFLQFKISEGYSKENWGKNEKQLIGLIQSRIRQLPTENEIHDPSIHSFEQLVQTILKMGEQQQIGNYISTSFSRETQLCIINTSNYLKHMVLVTFSKAQYQLTRYYLNRLLTLEDIYQKKEQYANCIQAIKNQIKETVDTFENLINDYLETGVQKTLQSVEKAYQGIIDKQFIMLCGLIYCSKSDSICSIQSNEFSQPQTLKQLLPYEMAKQIISDKIKWCKTLFSDMTMKIPSKLPIYEVQLHHVQNNDRKKLAYSLSLIRIFDSEKQYQSLCEKVDKQKISITKSFFKFIKNQVIEQEYWNKALNVFNYQFELNPEPLHKATNLAISLNSIIQNYLKQNCKEKLQINHLINQSLQVSLDGALKEKCDPFFKKLFLFKKTNSDLKEKMELQFKAFITEFEDKIIYFQKEQQKCFKKTDGSLLSMFEAFEKNKRQIYQILLELNDSNIHQFRFEKQQESLFKSIEKNIKEHTKKLLKAIQNLSKNPQSISFQQIVEEIQEVFHILQFIKKSQVGSDKSQVGSDNGKKINKIKQAEIKILKQTLQKSERILNEVQLKIQQMTRRTKVSNYQVNNKLVICYLVLKEFERYQHANKNQEKCLKRKEISSMIQKKLLYPFDQLNSAEFKNIQDYEKLNNVFGYLKILDEKFLEMEAKVQGFEEVFPFNQSLIIQGLFKKSFDSISNDHKEFEKLVQFLQLKHITNEENINQLQMNILTHDIKDKNQQNSNQNQNSFVSFSSQASLKNINERMEIYNDKQIIKSLINYLLKYEFIKRIQKEFQEQISIIEDYTRQIDQIDIKKQIINRIDSLYEQMQLVKNPIKSKSLTRQDLYCTLKQMEFISKVLKQSKIKVQKYDIQDLKSQIKFIIGKEHSDFDALYKNAQINYKFLKNSVDFDQLKALLSHSFSIDENNKKKIAKLLKQIQFQYAKNIKGFYPQLFKNTDVLLNMAQFKLIVSKQKDFKIDISYMNNDYKEKCRRYFEALFKRLQQIKSNLMIGVSKPLKEIDEIILEEQKIINFLPQQFNQSKTLYFSKSKDQALKQQNPQKWTIRYYITQICQQIERQISNKYFKDNKGTFQVTQEYRQIFYNTSKENKLTMKNLYIERCKKKFQDMQRYLNQDHNKLQQEIKSLSSELQKIPSDIQKQIKEEFQGIQKKQQFIISQSSQKIQSSLNERNLEGILREIEYAQKINSEQIKNLSLQSLEKYYFDEFKQLNFEDLAIIQKRLDYYTKIINGDLFIKIIAKNSSVKDSNENFVKKIQTQINESNNCIINIIMSYNQKISNVNKKEQFSWSKFQTFGQMSGVNEFKERVRLLKKFPCLLESQYSQFIQNYDQFMNNQKKETAQFISKFKEETLKPFKISSSQKYNKNQFIQMIKQLKIRGTLLTQMDKISKINGFEDKNLTSQIFEFQAQIVQLQRIISKKLQHIEQFDIQSCLNNDTDDRMADYFFKLEQSILIYVDLFPIISFQQKITGQNLQNDLKQKIYMKFKKFQQSALQDLNSCFQFPQKDFGGKIRKYYDFQKIMTKRKFKIFPKNIQNDNIVRKQLIQKFHHVYDEIEKFAACPHKKKEFLSLVEQEKQLTKSQVDQISKKEKQISQGLQIYKKQAKQAAQLKKKALQSKFIQAQTPRKLTKDQIKYQSSEIDKQLRLNILSKRTDAQNQFQMSKNSIKEKKGQKIAEIEGNIHCLIQEKLLNNIIAFQHVKKYFDCEQKIHKFGKTLNELLKKIQKAYTRVFTYYLYKSLKDNGSSDCFQILENAIFKSYQATVIIQQTKGQTIQKLIDSLRQLSRDQFKKNNLFKRYTNFEGYYDSILENHRNSNSRASKEQNYINQAKALGRKLELAYNSDEQTSQSIVNLIGYIFGLWSIVDADIDEGKQVIYLYRPHAGQVLAIFLLLGLQTNRPSKNITKRIIQVSTGQGKSVVLGVLSAYLALTGYHVYQACFSQYLSQRDYEIFKKLFEKLSIMSKISYNIFPQICKSLLDDGSSKQTFKSKVQNFIAESKLSKATKVVSTVVNKIVNFFSSNSKDGNNKSKNNLHNKKILLIDEADVFLDEHYLGQSYRPSIRYHTKNVEKLLYFIWSFKDSAQSLLPQTIIESEEFKNVVGEYDNKLFQELMKNQVHGIVRDLQNFKNDVYTIMNGKIYYKEGDGLSDKIRYGYRTLFSYLHCYQVTKQLNKSNVQPHVALQFIAASFSYSLLPQYFSSILGVTGTLDSMSKSQKQILKQSFQLECFVQPSIYPPSGRIVGFIKCSDSKLYEQIIKSIQEQIQKKRPILVFFKTKAEVLILQIPKNLQSTKENPVL